MIPLTSTCRLQCFAGLLTAAGLTAASSAWANSGDSLQFSARHEVFYDNNLFRVSPDRQLSTADSDTSDTINTTTLGVRYDKQYSLQRIEVDARLVNQRYSRFGYLDFAALDYRANWHWSATPRIRGNLVADRTTRSNSYSDVSNVSARNLRRDDTLRLNGEADLGAALRLIGAIGQRRQSNEQVVLQDRDAKVRSVLGGLRYVYPSGSYIGYGIRESRGEYLNRAAESGLPTDFRQTTHEIDGVWRLSGKTQISGTLSYVRRVHSNAGFRDFSTPLAELRVRWMPTGKLRLDAELEQAYTVTQTDYASYAVGRSISLVPSWAATAHTTVRLQLQHREQDYRGGLSISPLPAHRNDITRLARLALDWQPREAVLLTVQVQTEHRSSSYTDFNYSTHGVSLAGQLRF